MDYPRIHPGNCRRHDVVAPGRWRCCHSCMDYGIVGSHTPPGHRSPDHFRIPVGSGAPADGTRRWRQAPAIRDTHKPWCAQARCPGRCSVHCVRMVRVLCMGSSTWHQCMPICWGSRHRRGTRAQWHVPRRMHRDYPMAFALDNGRRRDAAELDRWHSVHKDSGHKD